MTLSLDTGRRIARSVHAAAHRLQLRPLTIVVLDSGGHVVVAERSDASPIGRFEIARGKAYGALALGMNSRAIMERGERQPQFVASATAALDGRVIPVPGGVLVDAPADGSSGRWACPGTRPTMTNWWRWKPLLQRASRPEAHGHSATDRLRVGYQARLSAPRFSRCRRSDQRRTTGDGRRGCVAQPPRDAHGPRRRAG